MSGENISPRRTRSGLVICSSTSGEGETGETPGSPVLGQVPRVVVPVPLSRLSLLGRGHGTGGSEQRGVEVVGRPAPQQRVGGALEDVGPEVIDLSDDEISQEDEVPGNPQPVSPIGAAFMEMQNNSRDEGNFQGTPQARSLMDITIDLTMSPTISAIAPSPQTSSIPSSSTVPPSCPSLPSIMCPVCLETLNSIRIKGYHLLSTMCGHVFCSHCLPECMKLSPTCPTCRMRLSSRDYHQLYLH